MRATELRGQRRRPAHGVRNATATSFAAPRTSPTPPWQRIDSQRTRWQSKGRSETSGVLRASAGRCNLIQIFDGDSRQPRARPNSSRNLRETNLFGELVIGGAQEARQAIPRARSIGRDSGRNRPRLLSEPKPISFLAWGDYPATILATPMIGRNGPLASTRSAPSTAASGGDSMLPASANIVWQQRAVWQLSQITATYSRRQAPGFPCHFLDTARHGAQKNARTGAAFQHRRQLSGSAGCTIEPVHSAFRCG
jgi:hypothetical protein